MELIIPPSSAIARVPLATKIPNGRPRFPKTLVSILRYLTVNGPLISTLYQNDTRDLLIPRNRINTEPTVNQPNENIGTMRNNGVELGITNRGNITKDLSYDLQVNFSHYTNEIIKLNEAGNPVYYGLDRFSNAIKIDRGLPISTFWGYQVTGFYNTQDDVNKGAKLAGQPAKVGTWTYLDRNNDGNINSA